MEEKEEEVVAVAREEEVAVAGAGDEEEAVVVTDQVSGSRGEPPLCCLISAWTAYRDPRFTRMSQPAIDIERGCGGRCTWGIVHRLTSI